jgi:hypothetical protein
MKLMGRNGKPEWSSANRVARRSQPQDNEMSRYLTIPSCMWTNP